MIKFTQLAPTTQGTIGLGVAIGYYCSLGYKVSIPLSDDQKYDLLIDIDGTIKKVQVKTTRSRKNGTYGVMLKTVCPKKTSKNVIKRFDNTQIDYVFILTESGIKYNIPAEKITQKNSITLNKKQDQYIVT